MKNFGELYKQRFLQRWIMRKWGIHTPLVKGKNECKFNAKITIKNIVFEFNRAVSKKVNFLIYFILILLYCFVIGLTRRCKIHRAWETMFTVSKQYIFFVKKIYFFRFEITVNLIIVKNMGQKNRNYCLNKKPFLNAKCIRISVGYKNLMAYVFISDHICISVQHIQVLIQSL
jgi:hypothetical protein